MPLLSKGVRTHGFFEDHLLHHLHEKAQFHKGTSIHSSKAAMTFAASLVLLLQSGLISLARGSNTRVAVQYQATLSLNTNLVFATLDTSLPGFHGPVDRTS